MSWILFILLAILFICYAIHRMQKIIDTLKGEINMRGQYNVIDMSRINLLENKALYMAKKIYTQHEAMLAIAAKIDELERKTQK